jgi:hypothetical protein
MKTISNNDMPRRKFIIGAAISSTGLLILPRHLFGGHGYIPPIDKVNIGIVGADTA